MHEIEHPQHVAAWGQLSPIINTNTLRTWEKLPYGEVTRKFLKPLRKSRKTATLNDYKIKIIRTVPLTKTTTLTVKAKNLKDAGETAMTLAKNIPLSEFSDEKQGLPYFSVSCAF